MASLDFSADKMDGASSGTVGSHDLQALVDQASLGTRTRDGMYEVKDWEFAKKSDDDDTDDVIARALNKDRNDDPSKAAAGKSSLGALGSIFARLTGSKVLSQEDLKPVLEAMKQHLMKKNVAMDISEKVCEGVGEGLVGKKVGGFQSTYIFHPNIIPHKDSLPFPQLRTQQFGWLSPTHSPEYLHLKRQLIYFSPFGPSSRLRFHRHNRDFPTVSLSLALTVWARARTCLRFASG